MDSKKLQPTVSEAECDNAEAAFAEFEKIGSTTKRCLRCGGNLLFEEHPSGYKIWCEKENCFQMTSRGI